MMHTLEDCKNQAVKLAQEVYQEGLFFSTWGNLSCRFAPQQVVITPSGIPYDELQPPDMAVVNLSGQVEPCRCKPSTELLLHLEIYQARTDVRAIIHTHSKFATVFAVARREIATVTEEMAQLFGGDVPVAAYALPGTRELAARAVEALGAQGYGALLANHGVVCVGQTLEEALQRCRVLERSAEILLWSNLLGEPFRLPPEEIKTLRENFLMFYGQGKE